MPVAIVPLISALASAAAASYSIYSGLNAPGAPKPPSLTPSPLTAAGNREQQAAVSQQLPNLQTLTGGSVSPEYSAQFGSTQAGVANDPQATGNIQEAVNRFFGLNAPGNTGLTTPSTGGGGGGILDLLTKPKPPGSGEIGGGGGGGPDFVNSILNSDTFRGLSG